jgi:signal transduction histidine kinase
VSDVDELRASRARLADAAAAERRRIERALHDGVQQDLIAISVKLQLARREAERGHGAELELLDELRAEIGDALQRVRTLAAEVHPAVLDARGLADGVRAAVRLRGVAADVDTRGLGRYPATVESAVYACCSIALAGEIPGDAVSIRISESNEHLRLELSGCEALDTTACRDVVEAAGGVLHTDGGRLEATFPLRQESTAAR